MSPAMPELSSKTTDELTQGAALNECLVGAAILNKLAYIAELDTRRIWRVDGCRDMASWVSGRYGVSHFSAKRWIAASHAITELPQVTGALRRGRLPLDKVTELTRFATPATEAELIDWAAGVSCAALRAKADRATRDPIEEVRAEDRNRRLEWWLDDNRRLWFEGCLPAEQGALVTTALDRLAAGLPHDPDYDQAATLEARRADALVALASQQVSSDPAQARAMVNLHVDLAELAAGGSAGLVGGGVIHPRVASALCCDAVMRAIAHDRDGHVVGIGRASRIVPEWLRAQLVERDGGCTFPGCHHKHYVKAHHIWAWEWGGPTNLDNLTLVCSFHHDLIHKHGWRVALGRRPGLTHWFRPNNQLYEPNRAPPEPDFDELSAIRTRINRRSPAPATG